MRRKELCTWPDRWGLCDAALITEPEGRILPPGGTACLKHVRSGYAAVSHWWNNWLGKVLAEGPTLTGLILADGLFECPKCSSRLNCTYVAKGGESTRHGRRVDRSPNERWDPSDSR